MVEPRLTEFGLQPEDTKRADDAKKTIAIAAVLFSIVGLVGYFGLLKSDKKEFPEALFALFVFVMPPMGPILFYFLLKNVLKLLWPTFKQSIRYADAKKAYEEWWQRTKIQFWQSLSGRSFEHELAALFRRSGLKAEVTSASGDKGVDIWLVRNGRKVPVQCKALKNPVGPAAARELFGTMQHFGVEEGILASVSGFTRGVFEYAQGKPIDLMSVQEIVDLQRKFDGVSRHERAG